MRRFFSSLEYNEKNLPRTSPASSLVFTVEVCHLSWEQKTAFSARLDQYYFRSLDVWSTSRIAYEMFENCTIRKLGLSKNRGIPGINKLP